jgi:eukaryotic-like serine/threonine-protein kinase
VAAPEEVRLLEIAGSISTGADVDWDRLRQQASDPATSGVLRDLQALEKIAAFHRPPHSPDMPTAPDGGERHPGPLGSWGHFTLLETIGEGSFGAVYRARDTKLQTDVALKLIPLTDDRAVNSSRVLKEARLLARVRHVNVVRVYGADVIDGRVGIWMEYIEGRTLAALLRERGPLGPREAALVGVDLCQALAAVHRAKLLHGDVKAGNIMREEGGRTVLMDFGTGKDLRLQSVGLPLGMDLAGTPLYLAPEVFRGATRSIVTDIYSLGVLLYHLVTCAFPVDGSTRVEVEEAHGRGSRTRLRDSRPDLHADFVAAVERAMSADPAERFQSIGAFEASLAHFLGRPDAAGSQRLPLSRRWWIAAAAAIALAGAVATRYVTNTPSPQSGAPASAAVVPAALPPVTPAVPSTFQIDTGFYARRGGAETRLRAGDRVAPGDRLIARLRVSVPTYVYIVNEDDAGEAFLLFPLPGYAIKNPIAPLTPIRIPGIRDTDVSWEISSVGGREHFVIFASRERQETLEEILASLPLPAFGRPIVSAKLPPAAVSKLRGVGRLSAAAPGGLRLATTFTVPLGDREETAQGLWVRQLTVENPR